MTDRAPGAIHEGVLTEQVRALDANNVQFFRPVNLRANIQRGQKSHAHPHHHHLAQGVEARTLVIAIEQGAGALADALHFLVQEVPFVEAENAHTRQIGFLEHAPGRQPGLPGRHQQQRFAEEHINREAFIAQRQGHEGEVVAPFGDADLQLTRRFFAHIELESFKAAVNGRHDVGQQVGPEGRRHSETVRGGGRIRERVRQFLHFMPLSDHLLGRGQQLAAGRRQLGEAPGAFEQGDAQAFFQGGQLGRQRWLGDIKAIGGAADGLGLRDGLEIEDLLECCHRAARCRRAI